MKTVRLFIVPTVLAWIAGAMACSLPAITLVPSTHFASAVLDAMLFNLWLSGMYIVLPGFFVVTLPLTFLSMARTRRGRASVSAVVHGSLLFGSGLVALLVVIPLRDVPSQKTIALIWPLLPYSLIGAWSLNSGFKKKPIQSSQPTPGS